MVLRLVAIVCAWLAGSGAATEALAASTAAASPHVKARLLSETVSLTPGKRAWLALAFEIEDPWHMYYRGQNDSGMPPQIDLKLPEGYKSEPIVWPAPKAHELPGDLLDYVYYKSLTLLIPIEVPLTAPTGSEVTITARVEWLVCDEVCVLEDAELTLTLPVRDAAPSVEIDAKNAPVFAQARVLQPKPLPKGTSALKVEWDGTTVTIDAPGATQITFFPDEDGAIVESRLTAGTVKAAKMVFKVKPSEKNDRKLLGILEVHRTGEKPSTYLISIAPPAAAAKRPG